MSPSRRCAAPNCGALANNAFERLPGEIDLALLKRDARAAHGGIRRDRDRPTALRRCIVRDGVRGERREPRRAGVGLVGFLVAGALELRVAEAQPRQREVGTRRDNRPQPRGRRLRLAAFEVEEHEVVRPPPVARSQVIAAR